MKGLDFKVDERIARIIIDRPHKLNALSPELLEGILQICEALREDESLRVVLVRGAQGNFSAGADLPKFAQLFQGEEAHAAADLGRRAVNAIAGLPQITVAAIEGRCIGGGVVLASACDLRWADANATLSLPELEFGLPLAWGGLPRLVRLMGESRALDFVLGCRPMSAAEALDAGLVSKTISNNFEHQILVRAARIASRPKFTLRATKYQMGSIRTGQFNAREDAGLLLDALRDPEVQEVVTAHVTELGKPSQE